ALQKLKQARGEPFQVWEAPWKDKNGGSLFTLGSRKPGFICGVFRGRRGPGILKPTVYPPRRRGVMSEQRGVRYTFDTFIYHVAPQDSYSLHACSTDNRTLTSRLQAAREPES